MVSRTAKNATKPADTRQQSGKVKVAISQAPVPRLPHERDESADAQASAPRKVMQQAAEDLRRGLEDTDRGPQMARLRKKLDDGRKG